MSMSITSFSPCLLHLSWASTLFVHSSRGCSRTKRRQRCWNLIIAAAQPPPKRSYYKSPSRAIEKGGGFYVPGLQGPRLRFFVPVASAVFLALNHLSSGAPAGAMIRSEGLAITAAIAVLGTAIRDITRELTASDEQNDHRYKSAVAVEGATRRMTTFARSNSVQWAIAVVRDMIPSIEIAHFRRNEMISSTPNVVRTTAGKAVERVAKEQRSLYIAKSSSLPGEVTVPFLRDGEWSILMTPTKSDDVVVFASREELSRDSRRWLEILSERITH